MNAAVRLLAGRDHSIDELRGKLSASKRRRNGRRRNGEAEAELQVEQCAAEDRAAVIERVIDSLIADGVLSDERFAESFVRSRIERGAGPVKIRAELRQRGVSDEIAEAYLTHDDTFWVERAKQAHSLQQWTAGRISERARSKPQDPAIPTISSALLGLAPERALFWNPKAPNAAADYLCVWLLHCNPSHDFFLFIFRKGEEWDQLPLHHLLRHLLRLE